jgi:hypothetical protein
MAKAVIIESPLIKTNLVSRTNYPKTSITQRNKQVKINEVLPFRVRFTNIMVPGYSSTNVPGIGLQIIGISNYIL